ncbi:helix-turn-helix transcriptional regulator [Saccharothrix yanglingensis]|uniref:LuxR family transcriptional regulator n=1 Tax=Saccharothrix yanglingensis TaxID=659496 RepID=A0ABU0XAQ7_9PSEU|nr:helix-turn-helix transcriptional regulator [Saccharothrix yanglingensis]MDQ2588707.1 LuxR family transcriptional regulator [Saccharothrix yanglingensis]
MGADAADAAIRGRARKFPTWPRAAHLSFFERSGLCAAWLDHRLRIRDTTADFHRRLGRGPAELSGREFCDLLDPGIRDRLSRQLSRLADGRHPCFVDDVALRSGAGALSGEVTGFAVHGGGGRIDGVVVLVRPDPGPGKSCPGAGTTGTGGGRTSRWAVRLTAMEARVLEGVAAGTSTAQLAAALYLSRGGVEYHVSALLRKLEAENRPALVSKACSAGILDVTSWPPAVIPGCVE